MNIEKELSQANNSAGEYLAPRVKVVEIKARRVMCLSQVNNAGVSSMEDEEGEW